MSITAIDLFCGAGGLTYGLREAGIDVVRGYDIDERCEYPYEANNPNSEFVQKDVSELTSKEVSQVFDDGVSVLAGCAPCQPFSPLTNGDNAEERDDWGLLHDFASLITPDEFLPDIVTMENVPDVKNHDVYQNFIDHLDDNGYDVWAEKIYCPKYGIPQSRKRWVLLASRHGDIELIDPLYTDEDDYPTVRDTIGGDNRQPSIKAGESHDDDPLHRSRGLSETNKERMRVSEPGKTWELWKKKNRHELLLKCHKKSSGQSYKSPYGIMEWDAVGPTITTQFYNYGSGRFGHPAEKEIRAISLREGAMLQTFPENYSFIESEDDLSMKAIGQFIGNAVPPRLGWAIGKSIYDHVSSDQFA